MFQERCAAVDPELSEVLHMIGLISGGTDNFWLDTTSEGMSYYLLDFSKETMLNLAQEYKAAAEFQRVAARVIDYLNQRPQLLKQLVNCWQLSLRPRPADNNSRENTNVSSP
jgi:hypothetical protein